MTYRIQILMLLLVMPLHETFAAESTPEEKGLALATEADIRNTGWKDQQASLTMILKNRHGQESTRSIRSKLLEMENDGDKALSIFDTPRDVKGTAFLSFTHAVKPDDQWLYLPALKRVKRISSNNKSGPFMGSEFAFEDLSSQEIEKYTYKWLKDEDKNGRKTFVIEQYPAYKHSGYTKLIVWLDKDMYRPIVIEFYDRKGSLLKTLTYYDYKQYIDKFWRPSKMEMINHLTNKSTILLWENYQFNTGLSERDFDRNSLKRAR